MTRCPPLVRHNCSIFPTFRQAWYEYYYANYCPYSHWPSPWDKSSYPAPISCCCYCCCPCVSCCSRNQRCCVLGNKLCHAHHKPNARGITSHEQMCCKHQHVTCCHTHNKKSCLLSDHTHRPCCSHRHVKPLPCSPHECECKGRCKHVCS